MKFMFVLILGVFLSTQVRASRSFSLNGSMCSYFDVILSNIGTANQNVRVTLTYTGDGTITTTAGAKSVMNCPGGKICTYPATGLKELAPGDNLFVAVSGTNTCGQLGAVQVNTGMIAKIEIDEDDGAIVGHIIQQLMYYTGTGGTVQINLPFTSLINSGRAF